MATTLRITPISTMRIVNFFPSENFTLGLMWSPPLKFPADSSMRAAGYTRITRVLKPA